MDATIKRYLAGLLHGAGIGLVAGWFLNSGYAFRGSMEGRLIFPAAIIMVVAGHQLNRRVSAPTPAADPPRESVA